MHSICKLHKKVTVELDKFQLRNHLIDKFFFYKINMIF